MSSDESEKLIKMEETLHNRVIGQEEAVVAISRAIRRARVGKHLHLPVSPFWMTIAGDLEAFLISRLFRAALQPYNALLRKRLLT